MPKGYVLWEGVSRIDNITPIVCIMTMHSRNDKTGDMVQTWILRQDMKPNYAVKENKDEAICGSCIHRTLRTCYVEVWQAPTRIYNAWKKNKYPSIETVRNQKKLLSRRSLRIGSYGDPAAVPIEVWDRVTSYSKSSTGYTHMWKSHRDLARHCMASVDTREERDEAKTLGFRTFRVKTPFQTKQNKEVTCPASEEAGKIMTCLECGYCNGNRKGFTGDVVLDIHGRRHRRFVQIDLSLLRPEVQASTPHTSVGRWKRDKESSERSSATSS